MPWVRGGPGPCFKHQGGGGWECGGKATPGTRPTAGWLHKCAASRWGSGSRPRPPPGPAARAYPRPGGGAWGRGGEAAGASLPGMYYTLAGPARGRRVGPTMRPAPRALRSGSTAGGARSSAPAASPRPRPPPRAGRAGGVVREARVTALSARGASTGRSVSAPSPPRAQPAAGFRVGGAMPPEPEPQPQPEP